MDWLSSHVLYVLLAVCVAVTYLWLYYNREKLNAKWYALLIISVMSIICGLTTVKFFAFLESLVTGKSANGTSSAAGKKSSAATNTGEPDRTHQTEYRA